MTFHSLLFYFLFFCFLSALATFMLLHPSWNSFVFLMLITALYALNILWTWVASALFTPARQWSVWARCLPERSFPDLQKAGPKPWSSPIGRHLSELALGARQLEFSGFNSRWSEVRRDHAGLWHLSWVVIYLQSWGKLRPLTARRLHSRLHTLGQLSTNAAVLVESAGWKNEMSWTNSFLCWDGK